MNDFLKSVAPSLATALLGPLGGVAISFIADKLGIEEKTVEAVTDAIQGNKMTAEQVTQIKAAEIDFQKFLKTNEIDLERIHAGDRDSARKRESAVQDKTTRNLAYLIVGGFLGMVGATLGGWTQVDSVLAGTLIGYLSAKAEQVASYYFGSSSGSVQKSIDIAKLAGK